MRVTFHGAAGVVTGSCFLVEVAGKRFLVDCGMFQGSKTLAQRNYEAFPFDPKRIDAVLLTHAHIDHSGLLPKLVRHGFSGPIYTTAPTADLLEIMLPDSAYIQETEVRRLNRRRARRKEPLLTPIYTKEDATQACAQVVPIQLRESIPLGDGITASFVDAGHVLGAAMITITHTTRPKPVSITFTGDIGPPLQTMMKTPETLIETDYLVMESTYGNRLRKRDEDRYEKLAQIVRDTLARGGNVIIPAFAVGRTQEILYGLHRLVHSSELDPGRIFVDSPLAIEAIDIYCSHPESFDRETRQFALETEECPLYLKNLTLSRTAAQSMAINRIHSGAVIISASGMCEAGRIKHHLKHNLWRKECSVVFVGYQAEGTLGRRIIQGEPVVRIHGEEVRVRAEIHSLEGFSAHADQAELMQWVSSLESKPRHVFLVHGEEPARAVLRERLTRELGLDVSTPLLGEVVECTPFGVTQLAAGTADESALETHRLWHAVDDLRRLVGHLERIGLATKTREQIFDAVEHARALAESARENQSPTKKTG